MTDPRDNELNTFDVRHLKKYFKHFRCLVHDADSRVRGHYTSYTILSLTHFANRVVVSYTKFTSKLLPAPYDSMCRDYGDTQFQSQHHCMESCAVNHSFRNNESYPNFMVAVFEPSNVKYNLNPKSDRYRTISAFCRTKCPNLDCVSNRYTPTSHCYWPYVRNFSIDTKFILSSSNSPRFITQLQAAIDFVSFITNFLGCIAFWTGICPFTLLLSQQIFKLFNFPFFWKRTKEVYITVIVMLSAAAYLFQVFTISESYFKYSTSNTIVMASNHAFEAPAIDFCFAIQEHKGGRPGIHSNDDSGFIIAGNKDRIKMKQNSTASIIYYLLHGMLCHSVRLDNRSLTEMYTDHGLYREYDSKSENYFMTIRSAKHIVSNYTLHEKMYFSMHSLTELAHRPAESLLLLQASFRTIRQHVVHIFHPRIVDAASDASPIRYFVLAALHWHTFESAMLRVLLLILFHPKV